MINGEEFLRKEYNNLDEKQYQPAGIDLTLGKLYTLEHNSGTVYGLLKDAKILPKLVPCETASIQAGGMLATAFKIEPKTVYVAVTNEKIKISKNSGQIYLPRSSLLSAGVDVRTAFGDPGFYGHLRFLIINHTDELFIIEKGARFAQLVDIGVSDVINEYDGDYNEG